MKPTVVSLFSGCGGFDYGLELAGAKSIFACDIFKDALLTYDANFQDVHIYKGDIKKVTDFPKANIVIGGYPCQGFSLAGKRIIDDPRNILYKEFVRTLSVVQPEFFIAENVKGLLTMDNGEVIKAMVEDFSEQGYHVQYKLYNAKEIGVPQDRERVFIVGVRKDIPFTYTFPESTHGEDKLPFVTMRDTISHLPLQPDGDYYNRDYSSRYMASNRKRTWDHVSYTIQASGRHAPMHPEGLPMKKIAKEHWVFQGEFNRRLSYKECALIQTFPDNYQFVGNLDNKYKMIGNAVPPLLAKVIAQPIVDFLNQQHT